MRKRWRCGANSGQFTGHAWFEPFGFRRGMQDPKTGRFLSPEEAVQGGLCPGRHCRHGDPRVGGEHEAAKVDWVFCYTYNALIPHAKLMKSIERFYTEVMPRFA